MGFTNLLEKIKVPSDSPSAPLPHPREGRGTPRAKPARGMAQSRRSLQKASAGRCGNAFIAVNFIPLGEKTNKQTARILFKHLQRLQQDESQPLPARCPQSWELLIANEILEGFPSTTAPKAKQFPEITSHFSFGWLGRAAGERQLSQPEKLEIRVKRGQANISKGPGMIMVGQRDPRAGTERS